MVNLFNSYKVFGAAAVLFAVSAIATAGNVSSGSGLTIAPVSAPSDSKLGPTMPPSPWDEEDGKATAKLGPTMPPSPWDEEDGK